MVDHRMPAQKIGDALAEANKLPPEKEMEQLSRAFLPSDPMSVLPRSVYRALCVTMDKMVQIEKKLDALLDRQSSSSDV